MMQRRWTRGLGVALALVLPGAEALAGCAAQAPELIAGPQRMPKNGALTLALSHPLWHSRRAATGEVTKTEKLGAAAEDLPFVLTRNGSPEPLQLRATRPAPRGRFVVEIAPAAGWVAGAAYELRCDVATKRVYPGFSATDASDGSAPTWGAGKAHAVIVPPAPPPPPPLPPKESCVTTGRGKNRTTTCTITASAHGSLCPPRIEEAHVLLRLPEVSDDHGGVITLEIGQGELFSWVPAGREIVLGLKDACEIPNFPAAVIADGRARELTVTPIDAAGNRGPALRVSVESGRPAARK